MHMLLKWKQASVQKLRHDCGGLDLDKDEGQHDKGVPLGTMVPSGTGLSGL